jgi:hypothetical protein
MIYGFGIRGSILLADSFPAILVSSKEDAGDSGLVDSDSINDIRIESGNSSISELVRFYVDRLRERIGHYK